MGKVSEEYRFIFESLEDNQLYCIRDIVNHAEQLGFLNGDPDDLAVRRKKTYNAVSHHRGHFADPNREQMILANGKPPGTRDYEYWRYQPVTFKNAVIKGRKKDSQGRHLTPCWFGSTWKLLLDPNFPEDVAPPTAPITHSTPPQPDTAPPRDPPEPVMADHDNPYHKAGTESANKPLQVARQKPWRTWSPALSMVALFLGALFLFQWNKPTVLQPTLEPGWSLALLSCRGEQAADRMVTQMLNRGFAEVDKFHVAELDHMAQSLSDGVCGPNDPDSPTLQRLAEYTGARFLLWGRTAEIDDGYLWEGVLWEYGNGERRMQLQSATADLLADEIMLACTRVFGLERPMVTTATFYSSDDRANLFYSEGLTKLEQNNILAASAYFETAVQYDNLFHLARIKQAVCLRRRARLQEADDILSQLLTDYGDILVDQVLVEIYRNLVLIRYRTHHPQLEQTLAGGKELAQDRFPQDYLYFLRVEGFLLARSGQLQKAAVVNNLAFQIAEEGSDPELLIEARIYQARAARDRGDRKQALIYLEEAKIMAQDMKLTSKEVALVCEIARMESLYNSHNGYLDAINILSAILEKSKQSVNPIDEVRVKFWLVYCQERLGNTNNVYETYRWVIARCEELGNADLALTAKSSLVKLLIDTDREFEAEVVLEKLASETAEAPMHYQFWANERKSYLFFKKKKYRQSLDANEKALQIARKLYDLDNRRFELGRTLNNRGEILLMEKGFDAAEPFFLKAIEVKSISGDPTISATVKILTAGYEKLGREEEASSLRAQMFNE